ncbi:hypothetical protein ACFSTH_12555 [Paenibacillus yanchengensis]|uniref:DUF4025 domain-containing protein n=1 Tax=Paenibacillus yanchengensis TaxID=2035833 RepID=A0ABW4YI41_9BACL
MSKSKNNKATKHPKQHSSPTYVPDSWHEGKSEAEMDIDRMINEGLGGGQVTMNNGFVGKTTTDTMEPQPTKNLDD